MTTQLPQPQQTPEQLRWQSDYIQEYYYMVDGTRRSFASFMEDMLNYPDFTVRQLLDYFSLEIADGREEYDEEEED